MQNLNYKKLATLSFHLYWFFIRHLHGNGVDAWNVSRFFTWVCFSLLLLGPAIASVATLCRLLFGLKLLFGLLSHLDDFLSDLSVALFELNNLILQLFVFVAQMLNFFWLEFLSCSLRFWHSKLSYLENQLMLFFFKTVDFLDQSDIFFHDLVVLLRVELCVLF